MRYLRDEIAAWEPELITAARSQGASWVSRWARDNSADLRELAGQVSAATGSTMHEALADDDPSALLSPLADAQTRLGTSCGRTPATGTERFLGRLVS